MIYLLYIIYAKINGETEAFLYSRKGAHALAGNEHNWFVAERILVYFFALAGAGYATLFSLPITIGLFAVEAVAAILAFSYFRDKWYYLMRDRTDGTTHGFKYQSPTDSSKINFNYVRRRNMFYISLGVLVVGYALIYILLT